MLILLYFCLLEIMDTRACLLVRLCLLHGLIYSNCGTSLWDSNDCCLHRILTKNLCWRHSLAWPVSTPFPDQTRWSSSGTFCYVLASDNFKWGWLHYSLLNFDSLRLSQFIAICICHADVPWHWFTFQVRKVSEWNIKRKNKCLSSAGLGNSLLVNVLSNIDRARRV